MECFKFCKCPTRFIIGIMIFFACAVSYNIRSNMSLAIIAMTTSNTNDTTNYGPRYDWSVAEQSNLLAMYFYGYVIACIPGGILAEKYGATVVVGLNLTLNSILTAFCPMAANYGYWCICVMRFLTGLVSGSIYPACNNLISLWAPPHEKGKFIATGYGNMFGTMFSWLTMGFLIEISDWMWGAFYIPAIFAAFFATCWWLLVADSPDDHRCISPEEKMYITSFIGDSVHKKKKYPPLKVVFSSLPYLGAIILHFGSIFGLLFLLTNTPKFMHEVHGQTISEAGIYSSLPYLVTLFTGFIWGFIGDFVLQKKRFTTTQIRKIFCIPSHIIPGLLMIAVCFVNSPNGSIALIILCLFFNAASILTNMVNLHDIAPNYVASLYGFYNTWASCSGFIAPLIVAEFTKYENTLAAWSGPFLVTAGMFIFSALVFFVIGSGDVQSWNTPKSEREKKIKTDEEIFNTRL